MALSGQRRSSGPRTFDRDQAVETAMRLFRRHGYEGVSIADLTAAIGIAPPSLYAAFGSKAGLYREALDRYEVMPGALGGMKGARTLEQAVAGLLDAGIAAATSAERGCMISNGLIVGAVEHRELIDELAARRRRLRDRIAAELALWLDPPAAARQARFLSAILQGIAVQARDGASASELKRLARGVVTDLRGR